MPQLTKVAGLVAVLLCACLAGARAQSPSPAAGIDASPEPFDRWLQGFQVEARSRGFSDDLIEQAFAGVTPLDRVVENDRTQAEVVLTFDRYLSGRLTRPVITRGREMLRQHSALLRTIEREYGVPRQVVVAVWGLESRFGRSIGSTPVFQALATLAWEPRRSAFFRGQLFDALTMVSRGYIDVGSMTGSWAGAMGQTQFMPSSYLEYAVDFDGDGRRDIWHSTPDALASIANYLRGYGWQPNATWGREVRASDVVRARLDESVPRRTEGCSAMRNMSERRPLADWARAGLRRADGGALPRARIDAGYAQVGTRTFLLYPNYDALLGYNCAHFYALSVAMLADRLK
jgi:membrane-bound lytic murein transglycosylase B